MYTKIRTRIWISLLMILFSAAYWYVSSDDFAPDVEFINLQGEKIRLKNLQGKVVIVNFWATSCPSCVAEMSDFTALYRKYQSHGLVIIASAMSYDKPNYVRNFTSENNLPFTISMDKDSHLATKFGGVTMTPTTFIISKNNRIVKRYIGKLDMGQVKMVLMKLFSDQDQISIANLQFLQ